MTPNATHHFDPAAFGAAVAELLVSAPLNELGPGRAQERLRPALAALTPEALVAPHRLRDRSMAEACLAGLWLRFDFLDESHSISQAIETPTGSYWHAIMHRREPDFPNSKYWFRRVGRHSIFVPLLAAALRLAADTGAPGQFESLLNQTAWDPMRFVDLCQEALQRNDGTTRQFCQTIALREWELLFAYCHRLAVGP